MIAVYTEFRPNPNLLAIATLSLLEVDVPRRERVDGFLKALAAGCPVIATPACGLDPQPGLTLIAADDVEALFGAVKESGISASAI